MKTTKNQHKNREFLQHRFTEFIPADPEEGILYISIKYKSAVHLCICGCKNKVVTPLTPINWQLIFDGVSVSLVPSIGNWNFPCQTHYYITNNKIEVMGKWSESRIKQAREYGSERKKKYYKNLHKGTNDKGLKKE